MRAQEVEVLEEMKMWRQMAADTDREAAAAAAEQQEQARRHAVVEEESRGHLEAVLAKLERAKDEAGRCRREAERLTEAASRSAPVLAEASLSARRSLSVRLHVEWTALDLRRTCSWPLDNGTSTDCSRSEAHVLLAVR